MTWNYRIVELVTNSPIFERHRILAEVHYDKNGVPAGYVEATIAWNPDEGESGLLILERFKEAFNKDVLSESDFIGIPA